MKFFCNQCQPPTHRDGGPLDKRWEPDPESYTGREIEVEYRTLSCGHLTRRETGRTRGGIGR